MTLDEAIEYWRGIEAGDRFRSPLPQGYPSPSIESGEQAEDQRGHYIVEQGLWRYSNRHYATERVARRILKAFCDGHDLAPEQAEIVREIRATIGRVMADLELIAETFKKMGQT